MIRLIPQGKTYCPIRDEEGEEYLGNKYSLLEVTDKNEVLVQNLMNALFGIPEDIIDIDEIRELKTESETDPIYCNSEEEDKDE